MLCFDYLHEVFVELAYEGYVKVRDVEFEDLVGEKKGFHIGSCNGDMKDLLRLGGEFPRRML
jgi:hypothetical protein